MKYIRTKDGIIFPTQAKEQDIDKSIYVKVADTIEELCDEFVIYSPNGFDGVSKRRSDNGHLVFLSPINESQKVFFKEELKRNKDAIIYGAIWTDKGLIYIAKMNEKGELELL